MGAIDAVCNLFTGEDIDRERVGINRDFMRKMNFPEEIVEGVSVEEYLEKMDRAGIERSFLIAVRGGDLRVEGSFEIPYERVHRICREHPGRFSGLAGVDPTRGMEGLYDLERAVEEYGFVGAHLYPHWFELPPDHAKYYPYYAKCCELGVPIMMQVGQCMIYQEDRRLPSVGRPITLDRVAIDFPELTLIGIHIGVPWTREMISVAYKHPNVYVGADAHAPRYWPDAFVEYVRSYGRDKVLFGTDWPVIDPERAVGEIEEMDFDPEVQEKLMHENARRIFDV